MNDLTDYDADWNYTPFRLHKATVFFPNDPSVGIFPSYFDLEVPDWEEGFVGSDEEKKALREEIRAKIKELYLLMDGDSNRCKVYFSDENHDF